MQCGWHEMWVLALKIEMQVASCLGMRVMECLSLVSLNAGALSFVRLAWLRRNTVCRGGKGGGEAVKTT
jgi:hypothetical protein